MEFDALRVLLQSYYGLRLCGIKQASHSWVMIERDESIRFIESDGNDGFIESDGNDEFIESSRLDESLRLNELYRRRGAAGAPTMRSSSLPAGKNAP